MDEREQDGSSLRAVHGAGLLGVIALLVAVCGLAMQSFLGGLGAATAQAGGPPDPAVVQAGATSRSATVTPVSPSPGEYRAPPTGPITPGPDQQASFLETVRLSGTGGWSSRLQILGYGVRACRLLADGRSPAEAVGVLVGEGEDRRQAEVVVGAAPNTLCPS